MKQSQNILNQWGADISDGFGNKSDPDSFDEFGNEGDPSGDAYVCMYV